MPVLVLKHLKKSAKAKARTTSAKARTVSSLLQVNPLFRLVLQGQSKELYSRATHKQKRSQTKTVTHTKRWLLRFKPIKTLRSCSH